MDEWRFKSALEQGAAIGAGAVDPVALTQAYLDAIAAHPHGSRIYARTTPGRALAEAAAARDRARDGVRRGPLDGVAVSWKDLFDTAGTATEAGSALLAGRVPDADADVLAAASAAGLVCLGKTHMSELAFSGLGYNPVTATPPCVNDEAAIAGGSSSGAAASVAFGLAAAAVGSDTGGSVRIPAAWNDLVGFKTTIGSLPMGGVVPLCARFDTLGPLTRTVADAAAVWSAIGGQDVDLGAVSLAGRRFAVVEDVALEDLEPVVQSAFEESLTRIEAAGAQVDRVSLPEVSALIGLAPLLYAPEAYGAWKDVIEAAPDKMFAEIRERFRGGTDVSAPDYVAALQEMARLRDAIWAQLGGYDAMLVPASPILPPKMADVEDGGDVYKRANLMALRNTRIGNMTDAASVTVPSGVASCGVMLIGPGGSDARMLRLAAALEAAF